MLFNVFVYDGTNKDKSFLSEVEAIDVGAVAQATSLGLISAYKECGSKAPHELSFVVTSRDFNFDPKAWKVDLATGKIASIDVPCGECLGTRGVDTGGMTPWGAPIGAPCPTCGLSSRPNDPPLPTPPVEFGELAPNGIECGKEGNAWVNCTNCKRRQTAALVGCGGLIRLPIGWSAGCGMTREVLCPTCSEGLMKTNGAYTITDDTFDREQFVDDLVRAVVITALSTNGTYTAEQHKLNVERCLGVMKHYKLENYRASTVEKV